MRRAIYCRSTLGDDSKKSFFMQPGRWESLVTATTSTWVELASPRMQGSRACTSKVQLVRANLLSICLKCDKFFTVETQGKFIPWVPMTELRNYLANSWNVKRGQAFSKWNRANITAANYNPPSVTAWNPSVLEVGYNFTHVTSSSSNKLIQSTTNCGVLTCRCYTLKNKDGTSKQVWQLQRSIEASRSAVRFTFSITKEAPRLAVESGWHDTSDWVSFPNLQRRLNITDVHAKTWSSMRDFP